MKRTGNPDLPVWAVAAGIVLMLALVGWLGLGVVRGYEPDPGPPTKVYPGMYNLRAEAAKAAAARANAGAAQTGGAGNAR